MSNLHSLFLKLKSLTVFKASIKRAVGPRRDPREGSAGSEELQESPADGVMPGARSIQHAPGVQGGVRSPSGCLIMPITVENICLRSFSQDNLFLFHLYPRQTHNEQQFTFRSIGLIHS
ncbi:hypothetical protein AV530_005616 [Patagioenas fasciata monilis]|uniref:Uncharacterized protein n=1 Tax=Patagioenas fasciata monilis TaxID=372326 RepID=A0A1V4JM42_PATFA|nr:hypothetical protein AV530_005616 [Patagioenas fasciata monilis]